MAIRQEGIVVQSRDAMNRVMGARIVLFITAVIMIFHPAFCDAYTATRITHTMMVVFIASIATGQN